MKILLVDDENTNLRIGEAFLFKTNLGLEIDLARNYKEAIDKIAANDYDFYVTDYRLNDDFSALDVIKKIKLRPKNAPILVITALDKDEIFRELQEAGADDFLVKQEMTIPMLRRTILKLKRWKV